MPEPYEVKYDAEYVYIVYKGHPLMTLTGPQAMDLAVILERSCQAREKERKLAYEKVYHPIPAKEGGGSK